jgi:hypothetical protein
MRRIYEAMKSLQNDRLELRGIEFAMGAAA